MRDLDRYRSMTPHELLTEAREQGIDPDMAVAMAEKLERRSSYGHGTSAHGHGGRYQFNHRSI